MKKNNYEVLWNLYHTILVLLLAGLLIVEIMEYNKLPSCLTMCCKDKIKHKQTTILGSESMRVTNG